MSEVKTYRKKPVEIEAMQVTPETLSRAVDWLISEDVDYMYQCDILGKCSGTVEGHTFALPTLEGSMKVSMGDYIIKGVQGEFYPIKEAIFRETYEPVEES